MGGKDRGDLSGEEVEKEFEALDGSAVMGLLVCDTPGEYREYCETNNL